jgi:hypothetical protein
VVVRPINQSALVTALNAILAPTSISAVPTAQGTTEQQAESTPSEPVASLTARLTRSAVAPPAPIPASSFTPLAAPAARPRQHRARAVPRPKPEPPPRRLESSPIELVDSLLPHADQLPWLAETSDAVLAHSLEVAAAEAGALLLRDGERWTVAAGTGLRPLELRDELGREHWLVATVCLAGHAVVVADTDIARSQLSGAPLASWRNLIAVPIADVEGILLLARREDPGFTEGDLERLSGVSREATRPLADAVKVRQLAREMARYVASAASD